MSKESATIAETRLGFTASRLPLFDQIAQGFLKTLASYEENGEVLTCLDYLDGAVQIDGASYPRRSVVFAVEDLKQQIEAPLSLRSEAYAIMKALKLDPVPELKLYGEIATAILRIDTALHLSRLTKAVDCGPIYH